jgi:transcription antitermination factor NusG
MCCPHAILGGRPPVPHHERLAHEGVALAFEIFVPRIRERTGARSRTTPLFGGYFFVRVIDQWRAIERTMGVAGVVKVGAVPSRCPDAEIAALLSRADPDGIIRLAAGRVQPPRRVLTPGAMVAIAGGPFRGFDGIYAGQTAQERELVLLNILGVAAGLIAPH